MLAVPPALLDVLHLTAGAKVGLVLDNGRLVVEPQARLRYTLDELLAEAEAAGVYPLPAEEREWVDAPAVGPRTDLMERGDIDLVDLEPTTGHEQRGNRSVLVVSSGKFNRLTQCPIILPITNGGDFARRVGFAVPISGIKTTGVVRCDQPRSLDLNARDARRVESLPPAIMDDVLARVAAIFV